MCSIHIYSESSKPLVALHEKPISGLGFFQPLLTRWSREKAAESPEALGGIRSTSPEPLAHISRSELLRRLPRESLPGDCLQPFGHAFQGLRKHDRQDKPLSTRNLEGRYPDRMLLVGLCEHRPDYCHTLLARVSLGLHIHDHQEMFHAKHNLDDKCLSSNSSPVPNRSVRACASRTLATNGLLVPTRT